MRLWINLLCTFSSFTRALMALPLPSIPVLLPSGNDQSELVAALAFVRTHPGVVAPLVDLWSLVLQERWDSCSSLRRCSIFGVTDACHDSTVVVYNHEAHRRPMARRRCCCSRVSQWRRLLNGGTYTRNG
ncbi:hypothetical protein BDP27DRAFT_1351650 [Rhodocollybia butyracea]|uniref:Secreted protein n=1 Tax=Rhodocollybia butyracea TaxID=206335 RepID=A0A9P5P1G8_9AGAR|nr:hypothetical protein BDP27DRAFT_1351650 [Rhodocollybia butyracea]